MNEAQTSDSEASSETAVGDNVALDDEIAEPTEKDSGLDGTREGNTVRVAHGTRTEENEAETVVNVKRPVEAHGSEAKNDQTDAEDT